jgi:hypothetical protein
MRYEEVMTAFFLGEAEATTAPPAVQNHFQGRRHQLVAEARDGQVSLRSWAAWVLVEVDLVCDTSLLDVGSSPS